MDGTRLLLLRLAITVVVAVASFLLVERPIREQRPAWVRGRARWIPIASATTAVMLLALVVLRRRRASGTDLDAAQGRGRAGGDAGLDPDAVTVLVAGDSVAFTLAFAGPPGQLRHKLALPGVQRLGCGLLGGTLLEGDRRGDSQQGSKAESALRVARVRIQPRTVACFPTESAFRASFTDSSSIVVVA